MPDIPHFALPFRFVGGRPVVNEQDSLDDVAACVEAVLRTRPGERDELPAFGTSDLVFRQTPLQLDDVVRQVETWEPRARVLADEQPDRFDAAVRNVRVTVTTQE